MAEDTLTRYVSTTGFLSNRRSTDAARVAAISLELPPEAETARLNLRDLVSATLRFEQFVQAPDKPSKGLHRMLLPHR